MSEGGDASTALPPRSRSEWLWLATCAVLLVVWPSAESPFHEPKRWLFALVSFLAVLLTLRAWRQWRLAALPLVVVATLQPSVEVLAFAWALVVFPALPRDAHRVHDALSWTGVLIAVIVVLQALGLDPFTAFGPAAPGARLARYGTLGNPDFVASVLLPLAVLCGPRPGPERWTTGAPVRLLLISVALALTQSLAVALGAGVAVLAWMIHRHSHSPHPHGGGARLAVAAALLLAALPLLTRDVATTTRGRAYLVSVALPHVADAPLLGLGAGAVVTHWPAWELAYWQARCADAACVEQHPDGRFTGVQDHVHADWLEWLLEHGVVGLAALGLALGAVLRRAWRDPDGATVFAALVAVLSRTLVDFPLARPADLCLLAVLASTCASGERSS